jgi:6-pyruvoyl-tetrahydropterin synthase
MDENNNILYNYDLELDENSPSMKQSSLINIQLKPHQLVCLCKAYKMEKTGCINYNIDSSKHNDIYNTCLDGLYKINTNIGIIGDIVGYGKTLTALSIIASCKLNDIFLNNLYEKSYISNQNYSYFSYSTSNNKIKNFNKIIDTTLIIVPRGPVYMQWVKTLKQDTNLKFIAIENLNFIKKNLPNPEDNITNNDIYNFFSEYDVVLIKNTTFDVLLKYYNNNSYNYNYLTRWKRIMIDEAHDLVRLLPLLHYYFLWLISGTYEELLYSIRSQNSLLYDVRQIFNDIKNIKLMLIKCKKEFVRNSFKLPIPDEKYYLCKMPIDFLAIKDYVNNSIIDKLNANDINGAIKELGGKTESQENIVELITKDLYNDIENKKRELEYVSDLVINEDVKLSKINKINNEINNLNEKYNSLKNRVSELSNKTCSICMDLLDKPIILKCTHSFCGLCIFNCIKNNKSNCPECRANINIDDMIAIDNNINEIDKNETKKLLSKIDTLIEIIKSKPNGKFLIFSKYESCFSNIIDNIILNNITYAELKGNTSHMMNILQDFKNSKIQCILLNTLHAGSGIDISFATDVIIYHSMGLYKVQAIGRAQRVGRNDKLYIHNLCYEQEYNK